VRASVTRRGGQANGASATPAIDGSVQRAPRCVAFQSQASNLVPADRDHQWDIYVRDLRTHTTRLVSGGVGAAAVDPAISGDCRQVAFTSAGRVYVGRGLKGGRAHPVAKGTNPDLSLDGSALTWERGHGVWLRRKGRTSRVAAIGGNPRVSDAGSSAVWAVVFDTPSPLTHGDSGSGSDVYMRTFKRSGGVKRTVLISQRGGRSLGGESHNGGITAYAQGRGIVVFATTSGADATLWYMNLHSGNIDDLAHGSGIADAYTSARANYVAFSASTPYKFDRNGDTQDVFVKYLGQK
jgi:Tol biopolymer transport system component